MEPASNRPIIEGTATRLGVAATSDRAQRVLRNTYMLLSASLLWSAACAYGAMAWRVPGPGVLLTLVGFYGLLFAIERLRNSAWSVALVFALTGFMGYTLGPILSLYARALPNGGEVIVTALGLTGGTFLLLSGYALVSRRRFDFLQGFLMVGGIAAMLLGLVAIFFHMPLLSLAVAGMFVLFAGGVILWQTGEIVHGGETNYVSATVTLYVSLYNLFLSFLRILGASRN